MNNPVQVAFKNMEASPAVEVDIRSKVESLTSHYPMIQGCRVVVEGPPRHQHQGGVYRVVVDVTVPGDEIVVSRNHDKNHAHEDVHVAVRDAFLATRRRLEDVKP